MRTIAHLVDVISEFIFIVIQSSIDLCFAPCKRYQKLRGTKPINI